MVRYSYNRQLRPPAAMVMLRVARPDGVEHPAAWPAQLDTGACRTIIPELLTRELALVSTREIDVAGLGGRVSTVFTHLVEIRLHDLPPIRVEVAECAGEEFILLGRDVLNSFHVNLDGPNLRFEIE